MLFTHQIRYCKDILNNVYKNTHNKIPINIEKTVAMETCVLNAELHPSASHSQYSILILQVPVLFKQPSSESTAIAHCRIILSSLSTANIKIIHEIYMVLDIIWQNGFRLTCLGFFFFVGCFVSVREYFAQMEPSLLTI